MAREIALLIGPATGRTLNECTPYYESPRVRQSSSPTRVTRHQTLKDPEKVAVPLGLAGMFHDVKVPEAPRYGAYFPLAATTLNETSCFEDFLTLTTKAELRLSSI